MRMSACAKCGAPIADDAKFCGVCGAEAAAGVRCARCGKVAVGSFFFCPACGARMEEAAPPPGPKAATLTITREVQFFLGSGKYGVRVNGAEIGRLSSGQQLKTEVTGDRVTVEIYITWSLSNSRLRLILAPGNGPSVSFRINISNDIIATVKNAAVLEQTRKF
jgi:RNA polymerase subunit RPABC4/transcription elongation factor Spt4